MARTSATQNANGSFLTVKQAAARSGIGEKTIRRAARRGELRIYRPGGGWPRLEWSEVETWIRQSEVNAEASTRRSSDAVSRRLEHEQRARTRPLERSSAGVRDGP